MSVSLFAARVKDIADISGVQGVQVVGYGIIVGLNNTGDNQLNEFTNQSMLNMLRRFGLTTSGRNSRIQNVASVMVTATVPTFMKKGSKIDVVVSSMGDATSLQGGTLILTPLSTVDGNIIGYAQGPVSVGGFDFRSLGSQVSRNFVTSGRVPGGLILEQELESNITTNSKISITLKQPDFGSVVKISDAINRLPGLEDTATPIDVATVEVEFDSEIESTELLQNIARIETVTIQVDPAAKVVINERTGTVVVGGNVELLPSVVSHGGLEISIQRSVLVPQPAPFTILPPRVGEVAEVSAAEEEKSAISLEVEEATVKGIAKALNLLEVKPRDLISIFQALKEAGSLQAELVIQ